MTAIIGPLFDRTSTPRLAKPSDGPVRRGPSTALEGTSDLTIDWDGIRPSQIPEWNDNNSPYKNLATNRDVAERALAYTMERVREYDTKTLRLQKKWQTINYLLQGNSLVNWEDPDGIHSPQLFQMVENLEARITDAVLGLSAGTSEWFSVLGREETDWGQEEVLQEWHRYVLDKNKFKSSVPEIVRTMLVHSFAVLKTSWNHEIDFRVEKKREVRNTSRGKRWITKRKEVEKVISSLPGIEMVDPFFFMCDTTRTDPQKMGWIADRKKMFFEEILELDRQGVYENAMELADQEPRAWGETFSEWSKNTRSQTFPYDQVGAFQRPQGAPKEFYVVEIWGKFDPYETGIAREMVITIANGQTVLRIQENPYDDKHRPYAIARACKYPFDFHSVGPLDPAIPLSIEIDTHRSMAVEGSRLSISPLVFTSNKSDIGDSLYSVHPGKVFECDPNAIKFSEIRSPVDNMMKMEGILRQDIEETTGSPRAYMGSNATHSMSATEYRGRIMEANKRIRGYIRSVTEMAEEMLQQLHSLCGQYLTSEQKFRVLGKKGARLRAYEEVNPEMFDVSVDFQFIAISNLHVAGMEATNLQLYMSTMAPYMQAYPGVLNVPKLAQRFAQLLLGTRADEYVDVPMDARSLMGQGDEIMLMLSGTPVNVSRDDDDEDHLETMEEFMETPYFTDASQQIQALVQEHYYSHMSQRDSKSRQKKANESRQQTYPGSPGMEGEGTGDNMVNMERANAAGGTQTNGPVNGEQMSSPGRMSRFFGEQNDSRGAA